MGEHYMDGWDEIPRITALVRELSLPPVRVEGEPPFRPLLASESPLTLEEYFAQPPIDDGFRPMTAVELKLEEPGDVYEFTDDTPVDPTVNRYVHTPRTTGIAVSKTFLASSDISKTKGKREAKRGKKGTIEPKTQPQQGLKSKKVGCSSMAAEKGSTETDEKAGPSSLLGPVSRIKIYKSIGDGDEKTLINPPLTGPIGLRGSVSRRGVGQHIRTRGGTSNRINPQVAVPSGQEGPVLGRGYGTKIRTRGRSNLITPPLPGPSSLEGCGMDTGISKSIRGRGVRSRIDSQIPNRGRPLGRGRSVSPTKRRVNDNSLLTKSGLYNRVSGGGRGRSVRTVLDLNDMNEPGCSSSLQPSLFFERPTGPLVSERGRLQRFTQRPAKLFDFVAYGRKRATRGKFSTDTFCELSSVSQYSGASQKEHEQQISLDAVAEVATDDGVAISREQRLISDAENTVAPEQGEAVGSTNYGVFDFLLPSDGQRTTHGSPPN